MNKSPAFQFYPDKWLAACANLSSDAYKAYHMILCWMWLHSDDYSSIPNTTLALSRATGLSGKKLHRVMTEIQDPDLPLFKTEEKDGVERLFSNGIRKEATKQFQYSQRQSNNAKSRSIKENA